jgi:phospholipid/cholesterol/gamma-HCH transport system substrate-binding protein
MEIRANYIAIGLFTLAVLIGAFGFVYWMARYSGSGEQDAYDIVFRGSVSGLTRGSPVLFNGIRRGEVESLSLDLRNPQIVHARVRVDRGTPVKRDTRVQLETQGLTGGAYVAFTGGSPEAGPPQPPVLRAEPSGMQDLVAGAQRVLGKVDDVVTRLDRIVADNEQVLSNTLRNAEVMTRNLAESSGKISGAIDNVNSFTTAMRDLAAPVGRVVERTETLVSAVDPSAVSQTLENVRAFSDTLANKSGDVGRLVDGANQAVARINTALEGAEGLGRNVTDLTVAAQAAIRDIERITKAIDTDSLVKTVGNVRTFSDTLAAKSGEVGRMVDDAASLARKLNGTADRLDKVLAGAEGFLGDKNGKGTFQELGEAARSFRKLAEDLQPKLSAAADNVNRFSGRGLQQLEGLIHEGRRTLAGLDRVIGNLERNPGRFLTGGSRVPEYNGR